MLHSLDIYNITSSNIVLAFPLISHRLGAIINFVSIYMVISLHLPHVLHFTLIWESTINIMIMTFSELILKCDLLVSVKFIGITGMDEIIFLLFHYSRHRITLHLSILKFLEALEAGSFTHHFQVTHMQEYSIAISICNMPYSWRIRYWIHCFMSNAYAKYATLPYIRKLAHNGLYCYFDDTRYSRARGL